MKKATLIASVLLFGAGAGQVQAQALKGSDTLEAVTNAVLAACPGAAGLTYAGGGSSGGENAMGSTPPTQQIAPMSRKVTCARAGSFAGAEGKVLGYDGIAVVRSQCTYVNGDCQRFSGALSTGYTFQAGVDNGAYPRACDKLRVLYFGRHNNNTTNCNSADRQALVASWDEVFEGAQGEAGCTSLRHAFRRDDLSGTTDTLRSLCGVPSSVTFCNGNTNQDNDPIRTATPAGQYDITGANGTLGVVLPITVPAAANAYSPGAPANNSCGAFAAGTTRCTTGSFRFRAYPGFGRCPDNTPRRGNLCRVPHAGASARCINSSTNRPGGAATFDSRIYNNIPRNDDGTIVAGVTNAFYRIHETRGFFGNGCKQLDATQQIGCLAAANGCSEGYAGREALTEAGSRRVQLANAAGVCTDATNANIISGSYPLSRKLYLSTLVGFSSVTGAEGALAACFSNEATVEAAITAANFVPDPASGIQTEDFNAGNCF